MIQVAVAGVRGRMGSLAADAVRAATDLPYVGGFAREADPVQRIYADLHRLLEEGKPNVLIDFTTHPKTVEIATQCILHGVSPVIGATGWTPDECRALGDLAGERKIGAMLVPNFAIGAALMLRFSEAAAHYFPAAEIVELHHDQKRDKPSGTARLTAQRLASVLGKDVPVHSVRLQGMLAHQEVHFGNTGETLTIRHDSLSRDSYISGILFAVRSVSDRRSLTVGLDAILERASV